MRKPPDARRPRHRPPDPQLGDRDADLLLFVERATVKKQLSQRQAAYRWAQIWRGVTGRPWSNKSAWRRYQQLIKCTKISGLPEGVLAALRRSREFGTRIVIYTDDLMILCSKGNGDAAKCSTAWKCWPLHGGQGN